MRLAGIRRCPARPFAAFSPHGSKLESGVHGACDKLYFQTDGLPCILYLRKLSGDLAEMPDNRVFLKADPAQQAPTCYVWRGDEQMGCSHGAHAGWMPSV